MKLQSFILVLTVLVSSWQFSASATPAKSREDARDFGLGTTASIATDIDVNSPVAASSSIDCITLENQEKQPPPDGGNSPNSPDSPSDIDDSDGGLDDLSADVCNYHDTPLFSVTGLGAVALRTPRIVPILLFPVNCFYCLHAHIRERAPPIPGLTNIKSFPCFTSSQSAIGNRHSPFAHFAPSYIPVIRICVGFPNPTYL